MLGRLFLIQIFILDYGIELVKRWMAAWVSYRRTCHISWRNVLSVNFWVVVSGSILLLCWAYRYWLNFSGLLNGAIFVPMAGADMAGFFVANRKDLLSDFWETSGQRFAVLHLLQVCNVAWFVENFFRLKIFKMILLLKHAFITNSPLLDIHFFVVWQLRVLGFKSVLEFFLDANFV